MKRRFRLIGTRLPGRPILFMTVTAALMPSSSAAFTGTIPVSHFSASVLSITLPAFIFTLVGAVMVMGLLVIFFSAKLRNANRKLKDRNRQIEEINSKLQKTNKDLSIEKEAITREYSYSEMFYKSLIQSADDGTA